MRSVNTTDGLRRSDVPTGRGRTSKKRLITTGVLEATTLQKRGVSPLAFLGTTEFGLVV
jgi:hypothetical protein